MKKTILLSNYLITPNGQELLRLLGNETLRLGQLPASQTGYDFVLLNEVESELNFLVELTELSKDYAAKTGKDYDGFNDLRGNIPLLQSIGDASPQDVMDGILEWVDTDGAFGIMDASPCDEDSNADCRRYDQILATQRRIMFKKWAVE